MTMEEAVRRVRQLCPDATYTNASVSFDFDVDQAISRAFSLHAMKRDYVDAKTVYSYSGCGSCWHEAVDKLTAQVQGTQDLKETIAETNGKQG
jgi:hypothetical protein